MPESFGVRLRQARERQAIALATVAEQTKIKLSLLQGLERDDLSHWPTGIFRRAFVRAYAAAIGMDQELAVHEFLEQHPDPIEIAEPVPGDNSGASDAPVNSAPPTRFRYLVGSLLARFRREAVETPRPVVEVVPSVDLLTAAPQPPLEVAPLPPAAPTPAPAPAPDLDAIARLCTDFSRLDETGQAIPLLQEAARLLDAMGLIVWVWDGKAGELVPVLVHGYSDRLLAQVPSVRRDSENATAAAFRSSETCVVSGNDHANAALVVPLMTPVGCIGVLAIELKHGSERLPSVGALATILAAQLSRLLEAARPLETADRRLA